MYFLLCVFFVTLSSAQFSNAAFTTNTDTDAIVFPDPTTETTQNRFSSIFEYQPYEVPNECKNQNYCTIKPKTYPEERFNKLFSSKVFVPHPNPDIEDEVGNKQGDPNEKDGCESVVTYEPIYNVKTTKGDWRMVIQSPKQNFVQKVRLETCTDTSAKCFTVFPAIPKFVTTCKQKYSTWELLVDGDNGTTDTVKVDLPICCSCVYKTVKA